MSTINKHTPGEVDNGLKHYLLDSDNALREPDNALGERDTCLIACYRVNGQKCIDALGAAATREKLKQNVKPRTG